MEYYIFTDESKITASRYQSISAFSLCNSSYLEANDLFSKILVSSNVREFKWQELKDAKSYFCAEKIIDFIFCNLNKYSIRIDTIIWDTHDSRHKVIGRDDFANYERMFYHLLNNSMKKRSKSAIWHIRPDQRNGINWQTIHECLAAKGHQKEVNDTIWGTLVSDPYSYINSFVECESHKEVLIQVADLFAGISVFSKESYEKYEGWLNQKSPGLFDVEDIHFSNREEYRFRMLNLLNIKCKERKLGVSLKKCRCLKTPNPENPINFWFYTPQNEFDNAPIRGCSDC